MITKIEGIIISEVAYGDTSKIVNVLTKDHGIVGVMCKGAKSLKSRLRTCTMKYTYGFFHVYLKEGKLSILKDVDVIDDFSHLKTDITFISYMAYVVELASQVTKQNDDPAIYGLLISILKKMNAGLNPRVLTNILEIKLLDYLGVSLNLDSCVRCGNKTNIITIDPDAGGYICQNCFQNERLVNPKTIKMLRMYYLVSIDSITELNIHEDLIHEIDYFLNKYYERYTGLYLQSKSFLQSITNM